MLRGLTLKGTQVEKMEEGTYGRLYQGLVTYLRLFQVPAIKIIATFYYNLINWQNKVTEPPLLMQISIEKLQAFIARVDDNKKIFFVLFSLLFSSGTLYSKTAREGFIKLRLSLVNLCQGFLCKVRDICYIKNKKIMLIS
ncbi:unnamed protein product [Diatraea saccharalis]|uniref:Uncharacterized protein n=1 Tax=Diatraea saccharalis TaxID=40085 RepID=A0A9N9WEG2_9NEOP|nr:unnamed protein product [Diatraea saccharalis]